MSSAPPNTATQTGQTTSKELNQKSKILAEKISECIHIADHDPSMALYRLQEHIHKTAPVLVRRKYANFQLNNALQNSCCDLDSSVQTLEQMQSANSTFERAHQMLRNSTFFRQQLNYEERRTSH